MKTRRSVCGAGSCTD